MYFVGYYQCKQTLLWRDKEISKEIQHDHTTMSAFLAQFFVSIGIVSSMLYIYRYQ
jgi:hypothetical protein